MFDDDATSKVFNVSDAIKVSISCVSLSKNIPFPALEEGAVGRLLLSLLCGVDEFFLESVFKTLDDGF